MKKYIDADLCEQYFYEHMDDKAMEIAMLAIDDMPAADVQEVRRGHWIDVICDGRLFECSVCGRISCCNAAYCNECGAKMDEVEE